MVYASASPQLPLSAANLSKSLTGFSRFKLPIGLPMLPASETFEASSKSVTELC